MNAVSGGAHASTRTRGGRQGLRRGVIGIVSTVALLGGGAVPAAMAVGPDAITSPVVITPDNRQGALLVGIGENSEYHFVDGGLSAQVTAANSSRVEFRHSLGGVPLSELIDDPIVGIKVDDPTAQVTMRLSLMTPDNAGDPLPSMQPIEFTAQNNGGQITGTADTMRWTNSNGFDQIPAQPSGPAFNGTLADLVAAYGDEVKVHRMGFDVGPNLVQSPVVIRELRVGHQIILFDLNMRDITINYVDGGTSVGTQPFQKKEQKTIEQSELAIPAGYRLIGAFPTHTIAGDATIDVPVERIPQSFDTTVVYQDEGGKVVGSGETISTPEGDAITAASLTAVPAGYELVDPAFSYTVTGPGTLVVPVRKAAASTFDVTVHYTLAGKPIAGASQSITDVASGTELTAKDLRVPAGYRLVDDFAPRAVTADLELSLPVVAVSTGTTPGAPGTPGKSGSGLSTTGAEGALLPLLGGLGAVLAGAAAIGVNRRRRA